jgi:hypothetical protein
MIEKADVEKISISHLKQDDLTNSWEEFNGVPGKEHYRLLAYLSSITDGRDILDIGTHRGSSGLALSINPKNMIYSFDIQHNYPLPKRDNISYHLENLFDESIRKRWKDKILGSAFIVLDIDPHEGTRELEFYKWLLKNDYKGYVVCDDIWYFKEMRDNFWFHVETSYKIDVTSLGHWSGTGIIRFHPSDLWPAADSEPTPGWTVVTAYFDLTKMPDASRSIKDRPAAHYLSNARATMASEQNLVVFCEEETVDALKALRPAHLQSRTQYKIMSFEDFPLTKFRNKIIQNRKEKPYHFDDRNTASYYLFCMARYAMLKMAIEENYFNSTHFSWLNICIERMGWKNVVALPSIWATK